MLLPTAPSPASEAVLTMAPCAAFSAGAAAWAQRNGPRRLVDRMVDQNSSVILSRSLNSIGAVVPDVPALLIRMSRRPSRSTARPTMAGTSLALATSPGAAMILKPAPVRRAISAGRAGFSGDMVMGTVGAPGAERRYAATPDPRC